MTTSPRFILDVFVLDSGHPSSVASAFVSIVNVSYAKESQFSTDDSKSVTRDIFIELYVLYEISSIVIEDEISLIRIKSKCLHYGVC